MKRAAFFLLLLVAIPAWTAPSKIPWKSSIDEALQEASKRGRPVFVDTFADWCEWCHKLDREVYSDPRFVKYMEAFVPVRIDIEDRGAGSRYAEQHNIIDLPTLLVLDSDGKITNRIGGFLPTEDLISDIDHVQRLVERDRGIPIDLHATYDLGQEYLDREMMPEAEKCFQKIIASPDAKEWQQESAVFSLGLAQFYDQDFQSAKATLQTYEMSFKEGASNEDALLLLSEIELQLNDNDHARQHLREFLRKYPNSENAGRAQQVLSDLKK
jgi:thioredoxin-like negative regulator of GroEL